MKKPMLNILIIIILSSVLVGCEKINGSSKKYPLDISFPSETISFDLDEKGKLESLDIEIQFSYKSDKRCYYKIITTRYTNSTLMNNYIYIRLLDKNDMILYDFSPQKIGIAEAVDDGGIMRGSFPINEDMFKELSHLQIYYKN